MNFNTSASQAIPALGVTHYIRQRFMALGQWLDEWRELLADAHAAVGLDGDLSDGTQALKRAKKLFDSRQAVLPRAEKQ